MCALVVRRRHKARGGGGRRGRGLCQHEGKAIRASRLPTGVQWRSHPDCKHAGLGSRAGIAACRCANRQVGQRQIAFAARHMSPLTPGTTLSKHHFTAQVLGC